MAFGGGVWLTQNKKLPGTYINFVSLARTIISLADRGYVAIPLELDWGLDEEVMTVENSDFQKNSTKYFGYSYEHEKLKGLRDLFENAKTVHVYRLNSGEKAKNQFATAKHSGVRGNDIKISVLENIDENDKFDVITLVDNQKVEIQTVSKSDELVDNDWVIFDKTATLSVNIGIPLENGTNGNITGTQYQKALDNFENYYFNILGCLSTEKTIKDLFIAYTRRMRDEVGAKFQLVLYRGEYADYEGVISVENKTLGSENIESSAVYWVAGIQAGCPVNKSTTSKKYTGDFEFEFKENQTALSLGVDSGKFLLHKVDGDVLVLTDINSFSSITVEKNDDFTSNQTIRVLDQIAIDTARKFNRQYVGKVPNDAPGRNDLWNDLVSYSKELERIRAIENFEDTDITVEEGNDKKSVLVTYNVSPVNCMEKLYMSVIVR